ncbi:MAG: hypothetical protein NTW86_22370 [Candidatus Sumerlaeota bacterium]|nr:hypothetical protein [Candidatus Sumerlaeota bacterium]
MVSGKPPFTEGDLAYQHLHSEPKPLENASPEFWAIVRRCLQKKRKDRWQKVEEIDEALKALK